MRFQLVDHVAGMLDVLRQLADCGAGAIDHPVPVAASLSARLAASAVRWALFATSCTLTAIWLIAVAT